MAGRKPGLPPTVAAEALLDPDGDGPADARFRQMVYDLLSLEAEMRAARDRLGAELGIGGPAYAVLMVIWRAAEAGVRVRDVAERLHVTGAYVTGEANKLVQAGLVEKAPDADDRRAVRLRLTDDGARRVAAIAPRIRAVNDHFFGDLTREEFDVLSRVAARAGRRSAAAFFDAVLAAA